MEISHLDDKGNARMVDVSEKGTTKRVAIAAGFIRIAPEVVEAISSGTIPKGDVLSVARVAGILAAKRTSELIPLCHPLPIDHVSVDFSIEEGGLDIRAEVTSTGKTGVEMEALTAVSVAALTIYDMCKSADRGMKISGIRLLEKSGGRSGHYVRGEKPRTARIVAACLSEEKGTSKANVGRITLIEGHGVEGDAHAGPGNRQVSFIGMETILRMREMGYDVSPGDFGENITTEGVVLNEIPVGATLRVGDVEMVVTQIGKECHRDCAIREKIGDCPMPREGIFAAVKEGGEISVGQTIEID